MKGSPLPRIIRMMDDLEADIRWLHNWAPTTTALDDKRNQAVVHATDLMTKLTDMAEMLGGKG